MPTCPLCQSKVCGPKPKVTLTPHDSSVMMLATGTLRRRPLPQPASATLISATAAQAEEAQATVAKLSEQPRHSEVLSPIPRPAKTSDIRYRLPAPHSILSNTHTSRCLGSSTKRHAVTQSPGGDSDAPRHKTKRCGLTVLCGVSCSVVTD